MKNERNHGGTTKKRRHICFPLRAAVGFQWDDSAGNCHSCEGRNRDISEQGMFVETPICPPLGTHTRANVWIQHAKNAIQICQIVFEGWVIRLEQHRENVFCAGFAMGTMDALFSEFEKPLSEVVRN